MEIWFKKQKICNIQPPRAWPSEKLSTKYDDLSLIGLAIVTTTLLTQQLESCTAYEDAINTSKNVFCLN